MQANVGETRWSVGLHGRTASVASRAAGAKGGAATRVDLDTFFENLDRSRVFPRPMPDSALRGKPRLALS